METDNKLLVRIDERQKKMSSDIADIKTKLECTVPDNADYKDMKEKVYKLWDERNKLIGWLLGAGIVGGTTGSIINNFIKTVLATIK
jgi:hypothetical protein